MILTSSKSHNTGFSLVEILVGVVILSLSIMTLGAALRQAFYWQNKQKSYEHLYITASSIVNEVVSTQINEYPEESDSAKGTLNGISYEWTCKPFLAANNFEFSFDKPQQSGNNGYFRVVLQKCSLNLNKAGLGHKLEFYRTQYCCPLDVSDAP